MRKTTWILAGILLMVILATLFPALEGTVEDLADKRRFRREDNVRIVRRATPVLYESQEATGVPGGSYETFKGNVIPAGGSEPFHVARRIASASEATIKVDSIDTAIEEIKKIISESEGIISTSEVSEYIQIRKAEITLEIQNNRLDKLLMQMRMIGKVESESFHRQDVTEEYIDVEARLRNLRMAESRLMGLIKQKDVEKDSPGVPIPPGANVDKEVVNVDDILKVEEALARIRGDIDSLIARKKYIDKYASICILKLHLEEEYKSRELEPLKKQQNETPERNLSPGSARQTAEEWKDAFYSILLIMLWPLIYVVLIVLAVAGAISMFKKRGGNRGETRHPEQKN